MNENVLKRICVKTRMININVPSILDNLGNNLGNLEANRIGQLAGGGEIRTRSCGDATTNEPSGGDRQSKQYGGGEGNWNRLVSAHSTEGGRINIDEKMMRNTDE